MFAVRQPRLLVVYVWVVTICSEYTVFALFAATIGRLSMSVPRCVRQCKPSTSSTLLFPLYTNFTQ